MAKLAKEATTVRRVLESLFRYFDNANLWSPDNGFALPVLLDMQSIIENFGQNTHFMLSIIIKHLDHKNVLKNPNLQLEIVDVVTSLAEQTKVQQSVAIIGALSDMIRHLRKSIHCSLDDSDLGKEVIQWNKKYREAVDRCLIQLTLKIGDSAPILDMMAVMLENMSSIRVMARTSITAVYRTAQIAASVPNLSYQNKAFPEALFHQLLLAMVYADHETRVAAHRIFSVVLVPSSICPYPRTATPSKAKAADLQRILSRTVSVFSSSAALFEKMDRNPFPLQQDSAQGCVDKSVPVEDAKTDNSILGRLKSSYSRAYSVKRSNMTDTSDNRDARMNSPSIVNRLKSTYSRVSSVRKHPSNVAPVQNGTSNSDKEVILPLKLSSHQITLLLSSLWIQSISPLNVAENYEAIAHTYSLLLVVARSKNSSHEALIEGFQLAFSLRSISLGGGASLQPSRRRSLFTLATSMIIFTAKAYNILSLVPLAKATLTNETVDPFLQLVNDSKLQAAGAKSGLSNKAYGSKENDEDALKSLSAIKLAQSQSKESFASLILQHLGKSSDEPSSLRRQLLADFQPDDVCPVGVQLSVEMTGNTYQSGGNDDKFPDKAEPPLFTIDDEVSISGFESQADPGAPLALENPSLLSVDELLDSVLEASHQVGRPSVSTPSNMPYKEMAGHCEALLMGKQRKLSTFMDPNLMQSCAFNVPANDFFKGQELPPHCFVKPTFPLVFQQRDLTESNAKDATSHNSSFGATPMHCATAYHHEPDFFKLPASSPYDNFLKAAGC